MKIDCTDCPARKKYPIVKPEIRKTNLLVIGEAPSDEEVRLGRPFVGPSGTLLNQILHVVGLNREQISVTNAVLCKIKDKKMIRMALPFCRKNFLQLLEMTRIDYILALGEYGARQVLNKSVTVGRMRGQVIDLNEFPDKKLVVTYHPSFLLRRGTKNISDSNDPLLKVWLKDFSLFTKLAKKQKVSSEIIKPKILEESDIEELLKKKWLAIDTEFEYKDDNSIIFVAVSICDGKNVYVGINRGEHAWAAREFIKRLRDYRGTVVVAARPVEERVFSLFGTRVKGPIIDLFHIAHLYNENIKISLENITNAYTNLSNIKEVAQGLRKTPTKMDDETLIAYAGIDAQATAESFVYLYPRVKKDKKLERYWKQFLFPVSNMLSWISQKGCPIDVEKLQENKQFLEAEIRKAEQKLLMLLPKELKIKYRDNLALTRDRLIREWFYTHPKGLRLKPLGFTPNGEPALGEDIIKPYIESKPIVAEYVRWKKMKKLLSTYLKGIEKHLHRDGKIYPTTTTWTTVTGRTSCFNPNLQNIPQRGVPYLEKVRELFIAPEGYIMGARDLSQSELRIMAWLAGENNMLKVFEEGGDVHRATAAFMNNISLEEVTKEMRQSAKPVNFGLIYDCSAAGLKQTAYTDYGIEMTLEEAEEKRQAFFRAYPAIKKFHAKVKAIVHKYGQVRGVLGRVRRLPEIKSRDYAVISKAERQAINYIIQNFSSDLALLSMYLFWKECYYRWKWRAYPLIFIHDAIFFLAPEDLFEDAMNLLKECMEERAPAYIEDKFGIKVGYPVASDGKYGPNWNEMKEWED